MSSLDAGGLAIDTVKLHGTIDVRWVEMTVRRQVVLHMSCVSVRWRLEIRYFAGDIKRLEIVIQELERGSLLGAGVPALQHQSVNAVRQRVIQWLGHTVALVYLLYNFATLHTCKNKTIRLG